MSLMEDMDIHTHSHKYHTCGNFARRKVLANFTICSHWKKFIFFNDYIENMATFTVLVKMYSTEYVCNIKVAGFGEIFVKRKAFHVYMAV